MSSTADESTNERHLVLKGKQKNMNGWVIVYLPGGDIYQLVDPGSAWGNKKKTVMQRVLRNSLKTFLTAAQLYWWIKS